MVQVRDAEKLGGRQPGQKSRLGRSRGEVEGNAELKSIYRWRMNLMNQLWIQIQIQISRSVVSDSLRPHESQHTRPPCLSPTRGVR